MYAGSGLSGWNEIILYVIGGILLFLLLCLGIFMCLNYKKQKQNPNPSSE
jgi:quinol-cytochrome oxidoreductase complex cytochrome b subunit